MITPQPAIRIDLFNHLLSRNFDASLYEGIVLDERNQILTVYLHNLSGQLVGYQRYNPNSEDKRTNIPKDARYFTHRTSGQHAVWGLETLNTQLSDCFVVEGIFKASALHRLGFNAIAVLCNNPKPLKSWLFALPYRLIAIGDNDDAGRKLIDAIGLGTRFEKDLDEYSLSELKLCVDQLLSEL